MAESRDGQGIPPAPANKGKGYGKQDESLTQQECLPGPDATSDEHGLENILVHVVGISGEWMWSGVFPMHCAMDEVQRQFHLSDRIRFGLHEGMWYKLSWDFARVGPYPLGSAQTQYPPFGRPIYALRIDLGSAKGFMRSPDTREVWITATRVFVIPAAVKWWKKQWDRAVHLNTYQFLVLETSNHLKMIQFVQNALVDTAEHALILDCADGRIPALTDNYIRSQHSLIMFDQAHVDMVVRFKSLFQASTDPVTYDSSSSTANAHRVCLHGVKLVIGSNCWEEEVGTLSEHDREWIQRNSIYVKLFQNSGWAGQEGESECEYH